MFIRLSGIGFVYSTPNHVEENGITSRVDLKIRTTDKQDRKVWVNLFVREAHQIEISKQYNVSDQIYFEGDLYIGSSSNESKSVLVNVTFIRRIAIAKMTDGSPSKRLNNADETE